MQHQATLLTQKEWDYLVQKKVPDGVRGYVWSWAAGNLSSVPLNYKVGQIGETQEVVAALPAQQEPRRIVARIPCMQPFAIIPATQLPGIEREDKFRLRALDGTQLWKR